MLPPNNGESNSKSDGNWVDVGVYGDLGFPKLGVPSWGSHNKDYSILGSILGSPFRWF